MIGSRVSSASLKRLVRYCCVACLYVRTIRELVERDRDRSEKELERYCELGLSWYVIVDVEAITSDACPAHCTTAGVCNVKEMWRMLVQLIHVAEAEVSRSKRLVGADAMMHESCAHQSSIASVASLHVLYSTSFSSVLSC